MTIRYAILGLLSWQPLTGYDLKKLFVDTTILYWSGNNNQIYRTLVQLNQEGLVTYEVQAQESLPAKKIYAITQQGLSELRQWVLSNPEPPELRNTFLIQLAWADQLDSEELEGLLDRYEEEVQAELVVQQEKARRGEVAPQRTPREDYLWKMISKNIVSSYEKELIWVRKLKEGLKTIDTEASR